MEIKQKVYVEGTSEKRALLKQACLSKSAAELEVDGCGTLLLISTPHVKLVTRPCVLCKQGYHVPEKPRLLKEHLDPSGKTS